MGSRTIDNGLAEDNMDMGVLACRIGMGNMAYIVYSYSLDSVQILEASKKEMASIKLPNGPNVNCMLRDSKLYVNGMDTQWSFDLIESPEDNFGAVIFSLTAVRGNETATEWDNFVNLASSISVYFRCKLRLAECVIERIEIPKKHAPFEDNGFSFIHFEVADVFRKSIHIKPPYKTTLTGKQVQKPSWYVTGNPFQNTSQPSTYSSSIGNGSEPIFKDSPADSLQQNAENSYSSPKSSGGCYVATAVYGSYDCPEVWTLRRFRDYYLANNPCGRFFIRFYYAVSPTLVKLFGNKDWFKNFWKQRLDKLVVSLKQKGYDDNPYND